MRFVSILLISVSVTFLGVAGCSPPREPTQNASTSQNDHAAEVPLGVPLDAVQIVQPELRKLLFKRLLHAPNRTTSPFQNDEAIITDDIWVKTQDTGGVDPGPLTSTRIKWSASEFCVYPFSVERCSSLWRSKSGTFYVVHNYRAQKFVSSYRVKLGKIPVSFPYFIE